MIPVRDEAETLPATLTALAGQTGCGDLSDVEVLLLLNDCRDRSREVADRLARAVPRLRVLVAEAEPGAVGHVGVARAALMDAACARLLRVGRPRGLVLTTDADTRPAPDWIEATRAEVTRGADAVGGRVLIAPGERAALAPHVRRRLLLDIGYRRALERLRDLYAPDPHDPYPRHHQHYGASLAVTASAYARCGGMPPAPSSEDVALVHALMESGARVRHSLTVRVWTSARRVGRAEGGLADALAAWERARDEPRVEPAAAADRRLRALGRQRRATPFLPPDLALLATPELAPGALGEPISLATRRLRERAEQIAARPLAARLDAADLPDRPVAGRLTVAVPRALPQRTFAGDGATQEAAVAVAA